MKQVLCMVLLCLTISVFAQQQSKPALTPNDLGTFPEIKSPEISSNGLYVSYIVSSPKQKTGILQASKDSWKLELPNVSRIEFSADGKTAMLTLGHDSVALVKNGTNSLQYLTGVKQCKLFEHHKKSMLAYLQQEKLIFLDLDKGNKRVTSGVIDYLIAPGGSSCLVKSVDSSEGRKERVSWLDIGKPYEVVIWQGEKAMSWIFDNAGEQAAFFAVDTSKGGGKGTGKGKGKGKGLTELYRYRKGDANATVLLDNNNPAIEEGLELKPYQNFKFGKNNKILFFTVTDPALLAAPKHEDVILMGYQDAILPGWRKFEQKRQLIGNYLFSANLENQKIFRLQHEDQSIVKFGEHNILLSQAKAHAYELNWNKDALIDYLIVSAETGISRPLKTKAPAQLGNVSWSPDFENLLYYDTEFSDFFLFSVKDSKPTNVTNGLHKNGREFTGQRNITFVGWLDNDTFLLDADNDILLYNLNRLALPINLTKGLAKQQHLSISVEPNLNERSVIAENSLLIKTFNNLNHDNGFWILDLKKKATKKLSTEAMQIEIKQRAENAGVYLITKETGSVFPNLYVTKNFQSFNQISSLRPERSYNYIQTELFTWQLEGDTLQGILYKPENFDAEKKYPLIFTYYPEHQLNKNKFMIPENSGAIIDIPFFVSNEYLVFEPFTKILLGKPGETALQPVLSAINYLKQFTWLDTSKLGLNGHSMGGFETNYIITKSNLFKAAVSCSGSSNLLIMYNSLWGDGLEKQGHVVGGQYQLRKNPFEDRELYFKNSPVLYADKVRTPLLLMHNDKDNAVPYEESLSFFLSLRRLGKPVWLLNYTNEQHTLSNANNYKDFQVRTKEFFDFYLKDKGDVAWMKRERPFYTELIDN